VAPVEPLSILFVGDVVGACGRETLASALAALRAELRPDVVIVNAENSSDSGQGVSEGDARTLLDAGADVLTTGNHAFDGAGALDLLDGYLPVIRPHNFHPHLPGRGALIFEHGAQRIGVLNLASAELERVATSPLLVVEQALEALERGGATSTVIDVHGAWPAEKRALAHRIDGRACAVFGTHTHIPTADAEVLAGGTAVISDVGMTGAADSLIGFDRDQLTENLLGGGREPRAALGTTGVLNGALVTASGQQAHAIERIERRVELSAVAAAP
jgi:metallophosphoesterase (TIGR00282 family)